MNNCARSGRRALRIDRWRMDRRALPRALHAPRRRPAGGGRGGPGARSRRAGGRALRSPRVRLRHRLSRAARAQRHRRREHRHAACHAPRDHRGGGSRRQAPDLREAARDHPRGCRRMHRGRRGRRRHARDVPQLPLLPRPAGRQGARRLRRHRDGHRDRDPRHGPAAVGRERGLPPRLALHGRPGRRGRADGRGRPCALPHGAVARRADRLGLRRDAQRRQRDRRVGVLPAAHGQRRHRHAAHRLAARRRRLQHPGHATAT